MIVMSNTLYHRIYEVVRHIPHGRVATYRQVALVVGPPVTAQQVGDAMAALRDDHPSLSVPWQRVIRSEEHTSELQSLAYLVCRLLLEKKKKKRIDKLTGDNTVKHEYNT